MMYRAFTFPVLVCLMMVLPSCVTHPYAKGFKSLERQAITSPSPDAILGMWYGKDRFGISDCYLFRSDGTLLWKTNLAVHQGDGYSTIKYHYTGNGWWTEDGPSPARFRLSGQNLLRYGTEYHDIYSRTDN